LGVQERRVYEGKEVNDGRGERERREEGSF
jgi:hypothetical protein